MSTLKVTIDNRLRTFFNEVDIRGTRVPMADFLAKEWSDTYREIVNVTPPTPSETLDMYITSAAVYIHYWLRNLDPDVPFTMFLHKNGDDQYQMDIDYSVKNSDTIPQPLTIH